MFQVEGEELHRWSGWGTAQHRPCGIKSRDQTHLLAPLEFKTGKAHHSHRAQVGVMSYSRNAKKVAHNKLLDPARAGPHKMLDVQAHAYGSFNHHTLIVQPLPTRTSNRST